MSGRSSRSKGNRREREVVQRLRDMGVEAKRVPLSGAAEGFKGDVLAELGPHTLRFEVKARANGEGFATLERWLGDNDALVLIRDRAEPMWVLTQESMRRLCVLVRVASNVSGTEAGD